MGARQASLSLPAIRPNFNRTGLSGTDYSSSMSILLYNPFFLLDEDWIAFIYASHILQSSIASFHLTRVNHKLRIPTFPSLCNYYIGLLISMFNNIGAWKKRLGAEATSELLAWVSGAHFTKCALENVYFQGSLVWDSSQHFSNVMIWIALYWTLSSLISCNKTRNRGVILSFLYSPNVSFFKPQGHSVIHFIRTSNQTTLHLLLLISFEKVIRC